MANKVLLIVDDAWLGQAVQLVVAGREKMAVQILEVDIPSGGGAPGGPDFSVQYNDGAGGFAGDDRFVYSPDSGQPAVYALIPADAPGWFIVDESNLTVGALRRFLGTLDLVATGVPLVLRTEDETSGSQGATLKPGEATGGTAGSLVAEGGDGQSGGGGTYGGGDGTSAGGTGVFRGGDASTSGATGSKLTEFGAIGANGGLALQEIGTGPGSNGYYRMKYRGGASDFYQAMGPAIPAGAVGVSIKKLTPTDQVFLLFENDAAPVPECYLGIVGSPQRFEANSGPYRFGVSSLGNLTLWPSTAGTLAGQYPVLSAAGDLTWSPQTETSRGSLSGAQALAFTLAQRWTQVTATAALAFTVSRPPTLDDYQLRIVTGGNAVTFAGVTWLDAIPTINTGTWIVRFWCDNPSTGTIYARASQAQ